MNSVRLKHLSGAFYRNTCCKFPIVCSTPNHSHAEVSSRHSKPYSTTRVSLTSRTFGDCRSRVSLLKPDYVPCVHHQQSRGLFGGLYQSLSQSAPVQAVQGCLLDFHHWSGLPWWALIALSTLAIRTALVLPLAVHQMQVVSRLARLDAEIRSLVPQLNKEVNIARKLYGFDEMHARKVFRKQLRDIRQRMIVRDNCHPFKTVLLVLFQMPLWVCLSVSLRNITAMAHAVVPGDAGLLKSEGLLWFPDLTVPDPVFLIPLLLLTVNLGLTQVHALRQVGKGSLFQKVLLHGSRVIIVAVAAAATINPASVTFYWLCSSTFGLGQNLLLMSPPIRRALGISLTNDSAANQQPPPTMSK